MGIVRPVMEVYPFAWLYFVPFILIATFMMLNLFIAVIVDAIQNQRERIAAAKAIRSGAGDVEPDHHASTLSGVHQELLLEEVRQLREELGSLRSELRER